MHFPHRTNSMYFGCMKSELRAYLQKLSKLFSSYRFTPFAEPLFTYEETRFETLRFPIESAALLGFLSNSVVSLLTTSRPTQNTLRLISLTDVTFLFTKERQSLRPILQNRRFYLRALSAGIDSSVQKAKAKAEVVIFCICRTETCRRRGGHRVCL